MSHDNKDFAGSMSEPPVYSAPAPATTPGYGIAQEQQQHSQPYQQNQTQVPNNGLSDTKAGNAFANQGGNVMPLQALTSSPAPIQCPNCSQRAMTRVQPVTGNTTHAWALAVCAICCLGCIPYCVDSTKDIEHHCGNCGVKVATWHRSGRTDLHLH